MHQGKIDRSSLLWCYEFELVKNCGNCFYCRGTRHSDFMQCHRSRGMNEEFQRTTQRYVSAKHECDDWKNEDDTIWAAELLHGKNFASTNFLHMKMGVTKKRAGMIFRELGWFRHGSSSNNMTYRRKEVEF